MPDNNVTYMTEQGMWAVIAGMIIWVVIVSLIVHLFMGFCWKKMAEKTGHQESAGLWWIPIVNLLIPVRIAGKPGWWILLMLFVPIANIITMFIVFMAVAEKLGKENWWGIIAVLFPLIGMTYLAFADSSQPAAAT